MSGTNIRIGKELTINGMVVPAMATLGFKTQGKQILITTTIIADNLIVDWEGLHDHVEIVSPDEAFHRNLGPTTPVVDLQKLVGIIAKVTNQGCATLDDYNQVSEMGIGVTHPLKLLVSWDLHAALIAGNVTADLFILALQQGMSVDG